MGTETGGLQPRIEAICAEAGGDIAVAARHLTRGLQWERLASEVFPSASVIKVPILVELFARVAEGRDTLDARVILREEDRVDGSGVLRELHAGIELTVDD